MSKSIGNVLGITELLEQTDWVTARYFLLSSHYRSTMDVHDGAIGEAAAAWDRVRGFAQRTAGAVTDATAVPEAFAAAMDDDLAVPEALAALFDLVRDGNRLLDANCSGAGAQSLLAVLEKINAVLAVLPDRAVLPAGAEALLAERIAARAAKDWARSDALRDELASLGVLIDDGRDGQRWRLAGPQA